jgi:DNA-binding PadR family transcriptional regulator
MWLGKFVDLEEDLDELKEQIEKEIFKGIKKSKLTPVEFTIIETIFNFKGMSGYDLIQNLNKQFAGTWVAQSGTIYPILSKLERDGFLRSNMVKTPIGPLRKVYFLTEAGEEIIKLKVNKNFYDQLKFLENFLVELKKRTNETS